MNWICDEPANSEEDPHLDLKAKHDFFMNIRQSFGRTALLLSGGGTLGTPLPDNEYLYVYLKGVYC